MHIMLLLFLVLCYLFTSDTCYSLIVLCVICMIDCDLTFLKLLTVHITFRSCSIFELSKLGADNFRKYTLNLPFKSSTNLLSGHFLADILH